MQRHLGVGVLLFVSVNVSAQGNTGVVAVEAINEPFNPEVDEYVVEPGDTLWDISERVVGSPWQWPRVWSLNPEITNPHWIYPGDIVRFYPPEFDLPRSVDLIADRRAMPEATIDEIEEQDPDYVEDTGPEIEVIETQVTRQARRRPTTRFVGLFVTAKELAESGSITNATADKILLGLGDQIFMTFPEGNRPKRGDRYMTFRTLRKVTHPVSNDGWGYLTQITGLVEVEKVEKDVARARIFYVEAEVERGHLVTPLKTDPTVALRRVPAKKEIDGFLLAIGDQPQTIAGEHMVVFIDRGSRDGIEVGNELDVFFQEDELEGRKEGLPFLKIGKLLVVDTKDTASTCLVTASKRDLLPGLRVKTLVR